MKITFPGGLKVQAEYKGFNIMTDQPVFSGGDGSAPAPFDLFLVSIGTCVGIYIKSFCAQRNIDTQNIVITQKMETNPQTRLIGKISFDIHLPEGFPEKYRDALIHAANNCAVKRHMINAPEFEYNLFIGDET
ncbi:MAG: OsmC family protein [Bacteroidales bacterium]